MDDNYRFYGEETPIRGRGFRGRGRGQSGRGRSSQKSGSRGVRGYASPSNVRDTDISRRAANMSINVSAPEFERLKLDLYVAMLYERIGKPSLTMQSRVIPVCTRQLPALVSHAWRYITSITPAAKILATGFTLQQLLIVTSLQLQLRLQIAKEKSESAVGATAEPRFMTADLKSVLQMYNEGYAPLVEYLMAVGNFDIDGRQISPRARTSIDNVSHSMLMQSYYDALLTAEAFVAAANLTLQDDFIINNQFSEIIGWQPKAGNPQFVDFAPFPRADSEMFRRYGSFLDVVTRFPGIERKRLDFTESRGSAVLLACCENSIHARDQYNVDLWSGTKILDGELFIGAAFGFGEAWIDSRVPGSIFRMKIHDAVKSGTYNCNDLRYKSMIA